MLYFVKMHEKPWLLILLDTDVSLTSLGQSFLRLIKKLSEWGKKEEKKFFFHLKNCKDKPWPDSTVG